MKLQELLDKEIDSIGDDHIGSNTEETPMKEGAFDVPDNDKISFIQEKVYEILDMLGMDLTDDSLRGTPRRVAKMFVNEIFSGLNPKNRPEMSTFENKYNYGEMLVEKNITLYSTCVHHLLPFSSFSLQLRLSLEVQLQLGMTFEVQLQHHLLASDRWVPRC